MAIPVRAPGDGSGVRRRGRRDRNHAPIRDALRRLGWSVVDMGGHGKGVPDLLVGAAGVNITLEVKYPGDEDDLTPDEVKWHAAWQGQRAVVSSLEDAITVVEREVAKRRGN